jgi:hypothetical protein
MTKVCIKLLLAVSIVVIVGGWRIGRDTSASDFLLDNSDPSGAFLLDGTGGKLIAR